MACYRTGLTNHRELGIGRQVTYYYALSNLRDGYEPSWRAIGEEPSQANEDETVIPAEQLEGIPDPVWDASLGRLVPRAEWRAAREEPEEALPTYSQGETIRLQLEVRDASGFAYGYASFERLDESGNPDLTRTDTSLILEYLGDDKEKGKDGEADVVEITGTLDRLPFSVPAFMRV
jgi:hypothetical protein